jgi:uncharacterized protein YaaW (UPF0174 family)
MNEWAELKARYASNKKYQDRSIFIFDNQMEDFKNFLVDNDADILDSNIQDELFRFKMKDKLGIVYKKKSGNLLAHNMAAEYHRSIGLESMELYLKDLYYSKFKGGV